MNALDPNWSTLYPKGAAYRDSGVGAFGGGNGTGVIKALVGGLRVPKETDMPYRTTDYNLGAYSDWRHIWWKVQQNVNDFNLDPKNLPRRALTAAKYYRASSYQAITANSTSQIEAALRLGREVVWDFYVNGSTASKKIWTPGTPQTGGGHSMLIVGYDRSSKTASDHHFICKNSWGSGGAMASGFTHISYSYIRNGYSASYIKGVYTPAPWPELALIGRRNVSFDGHKGTLDIYHMPGTMQWHFDASGLKVKDRRIGSFRTTTGKMRRVNGQIIGKNVLFWMRSKSPNMGYGDTSESPTLCQKFTYGLLDPATGEIAGFHQDNAGSTPKPAWGGYARLPTTFKGTDGYLKPVFDTTQANRPEQFLGHWNCTIDRFRGRLSIQYRDDAALSKAARLNFYGLHCEYISNLTGARVPFTARVLKTRNADIQLSFVHPKLGYVNLHGYMLSWQRGVFAGQVSIGTFVKHSFYAYRSGTSSVPGVVRSIGVGCSGSNGKPIHTVTPAPFLGKTTVFACSNGPKNGLGLWVLGTSKLMLFPGTQCWLRVEPLVYIPAAFSSSGTFKTGVAVANDRTYVGATIYSQVACFDKKINAAGITLSNSVYMSVGSYK